jgi:uncharacterized membrane protein
MKDFFEKNSGSFVGAAIAVFFGIIILIIGFWRTLLLILLGIVGFILGNERLRTAVGNAIKRIFSSND